MLGFKWLRTAAINIAGIELLRRIHKRQFKLGAFRLKDKTTLTVWSAALAASRNGRHRKPAVIPT